MSLKVNPLFKDVDAEARPLHLVRPGTDVCAMCNLSMYRMRFHYTDKEKLVETAFAAYRPPGARFEFLMSDGGTIAAYYLCTDITPTFTSGDGNVH
jgi:PHD/YefM family antitoxin component YafN of YafNO toxin-antitoxin module